jgi:sec-independent protein translocase protein TatA
MPNSLVFFAAPFNLGMGELLIILAILLLLFGGTKLPGLAKGLGQSVKEFKKAAKEEDDDKPSAEGKKPAETGKSTGSN